MNARRSRRAAWLLGALSAACGEGGYLHVADEASTAACRDVSECQDGLACNGQEQCEQGRCIAGLAPDCDDGDGCTLDGCNEGSGCEHVRAERVSCLPERDAGPIDAGLDAALAAVDTSVPTLPSPPADLARPPDVECPTSVASIAANTDDALRAYRGITCSAGPLNIGEQVSDLSPLAQLRRVGSLDFRGTHGSALAALTALIRVDGAVYVYPKEREGLTTLPALRWVGGDMRLYELAVGPAPFPLLRYVGGTLVFSAPAPPSEPEPPAVEVTFPVLEAVGGALGRSDRGGPMLARLPALISVGGDLPIAPGVAIPASLGALRWVGSIQLYGSTFAGPLSLPALERAGALFVMGNPRLTALDLPRLNEVKKLEVRLNPQLSRCQVDALVVRVAGGLGDAPDVACNQGCMMCDVARCALPGEPSDGQSTRLARVPYMPDIPIEAFTSVEQADELIIDYIDDTPMPAFALREAGKLQVAYVKSWSSLAGFAALRSADSLSLSSTGLMTLSGLEGLRRVGSLSITNNQALVDLSALDPSHGPRSVTGPLTIVDNPLLSQCEAERIGRALTAGSDAGVRIERNGPCADAGVDGGP